MKTDYYADLLIKQYRDKPKARATINTLAELMPMDALQQMNEAYSIDKAIGPQLSILARWVGTSRNFPSPRYKLDTYFSMPNIKDNSIERTDASQAGFQEFNNPQPWNGPFLKLDDYVVDDNLIDDRTLRLLIKLKAIKNNVRATQKNIDDALYQKFGMDLYTTWPEAKTLVYNCITSYKSALIIAKTYDWLPRPTDCRVYINVI